MNRTDALAKIADHGSIASAVRTAKIAQPLPRSFALVDARPLLVGLAVVFLFAGCVTNLSRPSSPNAELQDYKAFYVIQNETDNRGVSRIIEKELGLLGKTAKSGPRTLVPGNIDAIVTYHEDWKWDMTWYLLNLLIQIRDPKTNVLITSAASYRTSLARTEPELMAREVLESILK